MASFRSRLQIPSLISSKENGHQSVLLRGTSIMQSVVKGNIRSFWSRKTSEPIVYGAGNCGEPVPSPIVEPCKGCPSRCLEKGYGEPIKKPKRGWFGFKKEPAEIKEKPSNCVKVKPKEEEKLTWWETIVGPDPRRSWPDPCACRVANRRKRKMRAQDPRLKDPRYKETAGDVFLYTEMVKRCRGPCQEPQPKPPPSYRVPRAVLYKMITSGEQAPLNRMIANEQMDDDREDASLTMIPYRIPYEEMRPPEKRKNVFSCQRGIRSEDVFRPLSKDSNLYKIPPTVLQLNLHKNLEGSKKCAKRLREISSDLNLTSQKRSRIEQLKMLVQQKDTLHCMTLSS